MTKFKNPLQKELLQVGGVLVLIAGETPCHIQGLHSAIYATVKYASWEGEFSTNI